LIQPKPIIEMAATLLQPWHATDMPVESELRDWVMGVNDHGVRLDYALTAGVPEFSRSYLQQLVAGGAVCINGQQVLKSAHRLKAGDRCQIELRPTLESQAFQPQPVDFETVFEDEHLRVINKPAGLVVHPAAGNWSGTLLNGLLALDSKASVLPRAGIVHRLDKDTSGLMVVARTRQVMDALVRKIAEREIGRQYLALASRPWTGDSALEIDKPIGRDSRNRLRMAVVDLSQNAGKQAQTAVEVLDNSAQGCLLKCTLKTGRTHQIRVHMAYLGHPLLGDLIYGGPSSALIQRQALHAFKLNFLHPVENTPMAFKCIPPVDFQQAIAGWGLSYNLL
jgi:23S rRNA pseudouridine1911/1915/1917 synthase